MRNKFDCVHTQDEGLVCDRLRNFVRWTVPFEDPTFHTVLIGQFPFVVHLS